jgi:hypothetical protein
MKRSKKPLTFTAFAAAVGALSLAVEGCVYGPPPQEVDVYGPPRDDTVVEETLGGKPSSSVKDPENEVCVYGPAPDDTIDNNETDVYGPPPES